MLHLTSVGENVHKVASFADDFVMVRYLQCGI